MKPVHGARGALPYAVAEAAGVCKGWDNPVLIFIRSTNYTGDWSLMGSVFPRRDSEGS